MGTGIFFFFFLIHSWYAQYKAQCLTQSRATIKTLLNELMDPIFSTHLLVKTQCWVTECQTAKSQKIKTQVKRTQQLTLCNWLNNPKVSDGTHDLLSTLGMGKRWPQLPTGVTETDFSLPFHRAKERMVWAARRASWNTWWVLSLLF